MYPYTLPPLRHTGQVGLLPSETFKWRDIAKYPGWSAVLEPNGKFCRFSPQILRKSRLDKESTDALHQPAVERLCDAVMLRSVVGGEATFSALLLKEFAEGVAGIFAASIRSQTFDLDPFLSEHPSRIGFISVKSFILGPENGELGKARVIVGKRNIVPPSAQTWDRRGAPEIRVHFFTKFSSEWCLALLPDVLARSLGLLTRITNDCGAIVDELNAFNGTAPDHFADGIGGNMSQSSVQRHQIDALQRGRSRVHPFDFVQAILPDRYSADNLIGLVSYLADIVFENDGVASLCNAIN